MREDQIIHVSAKNKITLFGRLTCIIGDQTMVRFSTSKTALLLARLAVNCPAEQSREALCEMLWPDIDPESTRANLRQSLASLRRQIDPPHLTQGSIIVSDKQFLRLDANLFTTDMHEFEHLVTSAQRGPAAERIKSLERAVAISAPELLQGHYLDWVISERDRVDAVRTVAMKELVRLLFETQQFERSLPTLHSLAALDEYDDDVHKNLIRALLLLGKHKTALQIYKAFARRYGEDLNKSVAWRFEDLDSECKCEKLSFVRSLDTSKLSAITIVSEHAERREDEVTADQRGSHLVNLPIYRTRFFGRMEEQVLVSEWLSDRSKRLITLVGPGGSGKSRLCVEVVNAVSGTLFDRVAFVQALEGMRVSTLCVEIAHALGVQIESEADAFEELANALGSNSALVVIDNFEVLVTPEGCAAVEQLLNFVAALRVIVTTRIALNLDIETVYRVEPLTLPINSRIAVTSDHGIEAFASGKLSLHELLRLPCIAMFHDRMRLVLPDFALTDFNASFVTAICVRLDGLPLAIELAAAWAKLLTPRQILERLERPFDLLNRPISRIDRHKSLASAIEVSYRALPASLQGFFNSLSVFPASFDCEAAMAIADQHDAEQMLQRLADWSMVVRIESDSKRYRLLDTLREYANENVSHEERVLLRLRHFNYFTAQPDRLLNMLSSSEQGIYLAKLDADINNYRQVVAYGIDNPLLAPQALQCAVRLRRLWETRGCYLEIIGSLETLVKLCRDRLEQHSQLYVEALLIVAAFCHMQCDYSRAIAALDEALQVGGETMSAEQYAATRQTLGTIYNYAGRLQEAGEMLMESLQRSYEASDDKLIAMAALHLGIWYGGRAVFPPSIESLLTALKHARLSKDKSIVGLVLHSLAHVAHLDHRFQDCRDYSDEALKIIDDVGDKGLLPFILFDRACMANDSGYIHQAKEGLTEALEIMISLNLRWALAYAVEEAAFTEVLLNRPLAAAKMLGCVDKFRKIIGTYLPVVYLPRKNRYLNRLKAHISTAEYDDAYKSGQQISIFAGARTFIESDHISGKSTIKVITPANPIPTETQG